MPLLPASNKRSVLKVLDVKSVEHKGQKRKLLLAEDGTVYKVKRSRMEKVRAFEKPLVNTGKTGFAKRILV